MIVLCVILAVAVVAQQVMFGRERRRLVNLIAAGRPIPGALARGKSPRDKAPDHPAVRSLVEAID